MHGFSSSYLDTQTLTAPDPTWQASCRVVLSKPFRRGCCSDFYLPLNLAGRFLSWPCLGPCCLDVGLVSMCANSPCVAESSHRRWHSSFRRLGRGAGAFSLTRNRFAAMVGQPHPWLHLVCNLVVARFLPGKVS